MLILRLIQPCQVCTAALTVDIQDLGRQVGAGQRHVLHAASVGDAIVLSVHLELEAALHREGFSRRIHLRVTCVESDGKRPQVELYLYIARGNVWTFCVRLVCKMIIVLLANSREKETCRISWQDIAFLTYTDTVLLLFPGVPFEEESLWPLKVMSK